jgi:hypothetical protein
MDWSKKMNNRQVNELLTKRVQVPQLFLLLAGGYLLYEMYQSSTCTSREKNEKAKVQRLERQVRIGKENAQIQNDIESEMDRYLKQIGRYDEYIDLSNEGAI